MSDLRPVGVPVTIEGVERHLLFTINVCDSIQDKFDTSMEEVINMLVDETKNLGAMKGILAELLNDEVDRLNHDKTEHELKKYTWQEIGWTVDPRDATAIMYKILEAYGISIPESDEFESPNAESGQSE